MVQAGMFIPDRALATPAGAWCTVPGFGPLTLEHASADQGPQVVATGRCHRHRVFHLVLARRGRGRVLLDERPVALAAGDLVLTDPDQPHSFSVRQGDSLRYAELTFTTARDCGGWSALLGAVSGQPLVVPGLLPLGADLRASLETAIHGLVQVGRDRHPALAQLIQIHLQQALATVYRAVLAARPARPDGLELARLALERCEEPIDLAAAARLAGLSAKHFLRCFRERYGVTPMAHRQSVAMERALVLVQTTDYPIKAVAALCGFQDVRYFHRCFKRAHGRSPGRQRRL